MNNQQWSAQLTALVAEQLRRFRKEQDLTVQDVADACEALGVAVARTTITNLETGRRASVDLAEFLVLAKVLGVPPISLLYPLGHTPTVVVLPGQEVSAWEAAAWFTGETPQDAPSPPGSPREILDTFRAHGDAVATALVSMRLAKERRRKANASLDAGRDDSLLETAAGYEQLAVEDRRELIALRTSMRQRGLTPPGLPTELSSAEEPGATDPG
ncbi:helix-turn-helix transcriptional regulator [Streptomyces sp. NPDC059373]